MLFFDNHIPYSNEVLKVEHSKMREKENNLEVLTREKRQLQQQLNLLRDHIANKYQPTFQHSQRKIIRVLNQPTIILDRQINDGNRVLFANDIIVYTECFGDQCYGITFGNIDDPLQFQHLSLHTNQIRDISPHASSSTIISTVSIDKTLAIVDLSNNSINRVDMGVSLWSCCWLNDSTVIVGGDRGTIIGFNTTTNQKTFEICCNGPPLFSIKAVSINTVLIANGRVSQFFDVNSTKFYPVEVGQNAILYNTEKLTNSRQFLILSRSNQEKTALATFCRMQGGSVNAGINIGIPYFSGLVRPSILEIGDKIYVVLPKEDENDFSFRMISNSQVDLFMKWRNRFAKLTKPPVDFALNASDDFMLAVVTKDCIRVYALPIELE